MEAKQNELKLIVRGDVLPQDAPIRVEIKTVAAHVRALAEQAADLGDEEPVVLEFYC